MSILRGTYVGEHYRQPVTFAVVDSTEPYLGAVYVAPSERPDAACELSGPDFTRCTREDLREWAQAILTALDET